MTNGLGFVFIPFFLLFSSALRKSVFPGFQQNMTKTSRYFQSSHYYCHFGSFDAKLYMKAFWRVSLCVHWPFGIQFPWIMFYLISICTNSTFFDKDTSKNFYRSFWYKTEEKEREKRIKWEIHRVYTETVYCYNLKYVVVSISSVKDIILFSKWFNKNKLYRVHVGTSN